MDPANPSGPAPYTSTIPSLTPEQARCLVVAAEDTHFTQPRQGWAMLALAEQVGLASSDAWLRAWLAWHHARAANACFQPHLAGAALARARAGFVALADRGWQAACVWQACALPWTRPNYADTVEELEEALELLQAGDLNAWAPYCQVTLAHALLLVTRYDAARDHLRLALAAFQAGGDTLHTAQAWLIQSSLHRRQGEYPLAVAFGCQAYELFAAEGAWVGMARAQEHIATAQLAWQQYPAAARSYQAALKQYTQVRLPMFVAQCYNGLAQIYDSLGQFAPAERAYRQARPILEQIGWQGALADNLLDHGVLELYRGRPRHSLGYLERARRLYAQLDLPEFVAVASTCVGAAYEQLAEYQRALHELEQAEETFQALGKEERLAENQLYQARVWLRVGFSDRAQTYLEAALEVFQAAGRQMWEIEGLLLRVALCLVDQQWEAALSQLELVQRIAEEQDYQRHLLLAMRLSGQLMVRQGELERAVAQLEQARRRSSTLAMPAEEARCWLALADCYQKQNDPQAAYEARQTALALNTVLELPDVRWQAYAGLGQAAESVSHSAQALEAYRHALTALLQMRRDFTQPELVDRYLDDSREWAGSAPPTSREPLPLLAQALRLALKTGQDWTTALAWIEEGKAQIALRQFSVANLPHRLTSPAARQLDDLRAQMQGRPTSSRDAPLPAHSVRGQVTDFNHLSHQRQAYVQRLQRLERADAPAALTLQPFDRASFQAAASAQLGEWIALNYYVTDEEVIIMALARHSRENGSGAETCWQHSVVHPISSRLRFALRLATDSQRRHHLTQADWRLLGSALLPPPVWERLTPDTCLVIAPHRWLHGLAWPALLPPDSDAPLIDRTHMTIVPSWHSLQLLWARRQKPPPPRLSAGLTLAVTTFGDRHSPLLHVAHEAQALHHQARTRVLLDSDATWPALQQLAATGGLRRFPFWHLATHGLYDDRLGRPSGFALADGDIWLDQLWELAPLPQLVTFSACSGGQRLVLQGDEQVGLSLTCLAAGASSVVGSLWPVLDHSSAGLMLAFYRGYQTGRSPAQALAEAQRQLWRTGRDVHEWAGFVCVGCP